VATYSAELAQPVIAQRSASPMSAPDWSVRIPALDGLRGVAILLVLLRHSIIGLSSSSEFVNRVFGIGKFVGTGVDLFFVLSGFLIGGILLDARQSPRYYTTFYARRGYRILPLYYAVAGTFLLRHVLVRFLPGALGETSALTVPWASYLTFTQNFFMVRSGGMGAAALLVTWSLAIEEQFYLAIPFVIRKIRSERLLPALILIIAMVPLLRLLMHQIPQRVLHNAGFACFALMPCRADALCLGVLSAYLVRRPAFWTGLISYRRLLWCSTLFLFAGVLYLSYPAYDVFSFRVTTWGYSWVALFYTCCLLITVSSTRGVLHSALCKPWLMRLGTLAYCTYLVHYPLIQTGRRLVYVLLPSHPEFAYVAGALVAVGITLVLATLSWKYFEKPLLRRGHKYQYF
jgi:peptidoglycan/LPS O-acetylase OafA/YrhL